MSIGTAPAPILQSSSTQPQLTAQQQLAMVQLQARIKSGANWFYWIAGLSLINTIAAVSGSNWRFLIGLGVTQMADAVAPGLGSAGTIIALVIDGIALGFFVLMGAMAGKAMRWAFILGMVAFALDGGINLLARDFIGAAFHAYALYCIYRGFAAIKVKETVNSAAAATA